MTAASDIFSPLERPDVLSLDLKFSSRPYFPPGGSLGELWFPEAHPHVRASFDSIGCRSSPERWTAAERSPK